MELNERVVVVTGAAGGIGTAICQAFAELGDTVVAVDLQPSASPHADSTDRINHLQCDISDEAQVRNLALDVSRRFGRLDVLVNNAGIEGRVLPISEYPAEAFRRVLDVNLTGIFLTTKHLVALMKDDADCSVVNCASTAGLRGSPNMSAYVASKHGVVGLTRAMAVEFAPRGIRANAVCPGPVNTRMMANIDREMSTQGNGSPAGRVPHRNLLGRYGEPAEVSSMVAFLASPSASYITGSIVPIDGGRTAI